MSHFYRLLSWVYRMFGSPRLLTQVELEEMLRQSFVKGMEKRQKLSAQEKMEWCKTVWSLYQSVDTEKSELKKQRLIDDFFKSIK